jgi:oligosaccharide reducing-end xylanase
MCPPRRSLRSSCVLTFCLTAIALAGCGSSGSAGGDGGSGGTSTGSGGSTPGSGGSTGEGGAAGGSTGTGGATPATGGVTGSGGSASGGAGGNASTGGVTGSAGTAGQAGGGAAGKGGGNGTGGAAGSRAGGAGGGATAGAGGGSGGSAPGGSSGSPGAGCTPPATYTNLFVTVSGHTQADSDTKVAAAWTSMFTAGSSSSIYYNGPGSDESYVEDTYNNDVRTEGMSYGMIIALQLDHQTEFDRLWTFVKNHMAQGTGQIAWHVSTSGSKLATGGAPDGDEYFAAALVFAHTRWGDTSGKYNYATEAQWVLNLIRTQDFNTTYHIVEFYAGAGNTDGSYILPAFYQTWACFDTANAAFWNSAVSAGRTWFHNAINSNGVIPDQSAFTNGSSGGAGADTIRCVANIMMDHNFFAADSWQTDTYAPKYSSYESSHSSGVAQQSCDALLGFGLPTSTGKPFVDKLWSTAVPKHDYWNGVLYMLAMLHVSGTFHLWY